jgi:hypothetical protein
MGTTYGNIDVARTLSLTRTEPAGVLTLPSDIERSQDHAFSCLVTFPSGLTDGCLYEAGATGDGCFVGVTAGIFTVAAGTGTRTTTTNDAAIILLTDYPKDDLPHLVAWEFRVNPGRVRVWIDSKLVAEENTTSGGVLGLSEWAGSNGAGYTVADSLVCASGTLTAWPGTAITDLKIYSNQLIPQ